MALACTSQFMVILDASIVNVALPSIRRELGFTPTGLPWVVSGYLLTFAGFMLLGGRAADLFGHRRMLAAGLFLFSASSLAGGLATAPEVLVAARVAQGTGAAMLAPTTLAVINTSFTEEHARARAVGVWSAAGGVGGMAGAIAGGVITTGLSWRWVFLINVPIGAVLIVVAMMSLAGTRTGQRESLDLTGAVTGTAGLAALIYGVMQSADHGWTSMLVVGPAVAGLLLLVVFTVLQARFATQPMMPLRLFRIRGWPSATECCCCSEGLRSRCGTSRRCSCRTYSAIARQAGLGQTPAAVTFVVIARLAGALLPRKGVRPLVRAGCNCFVAGFGWLAHAHADSGYVWSMNCLSCAAGAPNRVGVPNANASAHARSSIEACAIAAAASACRRHSGFWSIALSGASSATRRSRTSAPAEAAPSATACASACTVPVAL